MTSITLSLPLVSPTADAPLPGAAGTRPPARFAAPPWHESHARWQEIEQRLPSDHLARRLDRAVDRLDLTDLFASYGHVGSLPYPPALLLKVVLYETQQGQHSPARWACDARENEPLRWLARGCEPSRARWYAFRDRLERVLPGWHRQVLQQALALGLTDGGRAALDGTAVAAQASRHRLVNEEALRQRLQQLTQALAADTGGVDAGPALGDHVERRVDTAAVDTAAVDTAAVDTAAADTPAADTPAADTPAAPQKRPYWMAPTPRGRRQQQQRYQRAASFLQERLRRNALRRREDRRPPDKVSISLSDPEAALGQDKFKIYRPLYNAQLLVDLDSPLVLSYAVFAQPTDDGTLAPMLERTRQALGRVPAVLLGDAKYAAGVQLAAAEQLGVTVYAPWQEKEPGRRTRQGTAEQLPKSQFRWLEEQQAYECPQGHPLPLTGRSVERRSGEERVRWQYRCAKEHCRDCPLRTRCMPSGAASRTISRHAYEQAIEALQKRMQTAEARALYRLRKQTVERSIAELKEHRRLRRFSGRGRQRAECQLGLTVVVQNLLTVDEAATSTPALTTATNAEIST